MVDIRSRVSNALRRRLAPNTGVHVKQLAGSIDRSGETVRLWLAGAADIKAVDLAAIAESLRDPSIIDEIFGTTAQLRPLGERSWWFLDDGTSHDSAASDGGLPPHHSRLSAYQGDVSFPLYMMRDCGAMELKVRDALVHLRYHAKGIARAAAEATRNWLIAHAHRISDISRSVFIDTEWIKAANLPVASVAHELTITTSLSLPWRKERKVLDLLPPRLGKVLHAWRNAPGDVLNAAGSVGLGNRASMYTADEAGNVVCGWLGPALNMPRDCVGRNVLGWSDPAFGVEMRHTILEAREESATYTELKIPVFGTIRHFDRLSLKVYDGVVTITESRSR
jgi:hypothetical protein